MESSMKHRAEWAKKASIDLAATDGNTKDRALKAIAKALSDHADQIFEANERDLKRSEAEGLSTPLLKRLKLDKKKLEGLIDGIHTLIKADDPVGETQLSRELYPGLNLYRLSAPIGVLGIIFESRPDALVQISTLCLKSGNAVLLKGGREAMETNRILFETIYNASVEAGLPEGWMALMESRSEVSDMLSLDEYIDLIIPRGSNAFVKYIMDNSNIPVLGHADGICHVYVDEHANIQKAIPVCVDAKVQYVSVCNAMETLLVHEHIAEELLPELQSAMEVHRVRLIGCERTQKIINVSPATDADWDTEYLEYVLSIKVVNDINEAINHINRHGSKHTDAILTDFKQNAKHFISRIDSGSVLMNCSTRFADGFRYGFGAEVGIATGKLHTRGPVGMEGLLTYKYVLLGNYDTVAPFANGDQSYTHIDNKDKYSL